MDSLALALTSIHWSLILIAALMTFDITFASLMLHRLGQIMRDVHADVGQISKQVAQDSVLLRETHALTAQAAAALDNVARLVVYPGGRPK